MKEPFIDRARLVVLPCRACSAPQEQWRSPNDPVPLVLCRACTHAGHRAHYGRCARCEQAVAHPWVEWCAACWTALPPHAVQLYRASGLAACLVFLEGRDLCLVRRSGYHR